MIIEMITLAAGPGGVLQPGQKYPVPEAFGQALAAAGAAKIVGAEKQPAPRVESAAIEPPEQAVLSPPAAKKAPARNRKK